MEKVCRKKYSGCPLCEGTDIAHIGSSDCTSHALYKPQLPTRIDWNKCTTCGHIFSDGYFSPKALEILLGSSHCGQIFNTDSLERELVQASIIIDKVSAYIPQQAGAWLDVGFGSGALLTTCYEYGFDPIGLDLRRESVEKLRKLGFKAYCTDLTKFRPNNKFMVISMADVLEHMPYPKFALHRCHELLKEGGVLFLSCPNCDSVLWKALTVESKNPYWMELEHYHNFGKKRLYALLAEHGFKPVNYGISQRYRIGMEIIALKE